MYKRHRILLPVLFLLVSALSYFLYADYSAVAETAVTVVSIALAVYIGGTSALLGSPYAERLKKSRDTEDTTKTSLGVLATYLRLAGLFSIITLVISSVYVLDIDWQTVFHISEENNILEPILHILSSISCGLFLLNIAFIWLILLFLINSLSKSIQY